MRRKMWRHRVTDSGQVSLPADVRHRWGASVVLIEDQGDRLVLRPAAENPLEEVRGRLRDNRTKIASSEALRHAREQDNAATERKWREHNGE